MSEQENKSSQPLSNMTSSSGTSPQGIPPVQPTQDQFNTVFAQLLSNLRRQDDVESVSNTSEQSTDEDQESVEEIVIPSQTREEKQARHATLKALLESHKLICEAVLFHLRQK